MIFLAILLLLASALTVIEILSFGKIVGFIGFNSTGAQNDGVPSGNQDILIFGVYAFLFILVSAFIFDYLNKYHDRLNLRNSGHEDVPFKKKVIKLDLSGSPKDNDNF